MPIDDSRSSDLCCSAGRCTKTLVNYQLEFNTRKSETKRDEITIALSNCIGCQCTSITLESVA